VQETIKLRLLGSNVDVSRSGLEIRRSNHSHFPISRAFSGLRLYDLHWAMTNTDTILPPALTGRTNVTGISVPAYAATNVSVELEPIPDL
jgi:hypothetical protein